MKKQFYHSYFDAKRILLGIELDLFAEPEVEHYPMRAADTDPRETYNPQQQLAAAVLEKALQRANRTDADGRPVRVPTDEWREAVAFWMSGDCMGWVMLAGMDPDGVERVREHLERVFTSTATALRSA